MRILIYGAGVIGSVYAAHLHNGGHEVSVLARGRRLAEIRERGVELEAAATGVRIQARVPSVAELGVEDAYDLVLVTVQKGHIAAVLPTLAANRNTPSIAFLGNNASGPDQLVEALGAERVLMGFPDVGGYFDGPRVRFAAQGGAAQRFGITLGELSGRTTPRLHTIVEAFATAGMAVAVESDIDAWLKGHVALVVPIFYALERHGSDNLALARDRNTLRLMAAAVREGLAFLRKLGYRITPLKLRTIAWLPLFVTVAIFAKIIGSDFAKVAFAGHAVAAAGEFELLREELLVLAASSGLATPALHELCGSRPEAPAELGPR